VRCNAVSDAEATADPLHRRKRCRVSGLSKAPAAAERLAELVMTVAGN